MANEDKALIQQQSDISLNKPNSPTFIGDNTHVSLTIHQYNQHPPAIYEHVQPSLNQLQDADQRVIYDEVQDEEKRTILDKQNNDDYVKPILNQVQNQIAQIEERNQQNDQEAGVRRDPQNYHEDIVVAQGDQEDSFVQTELDKKEPEKKSLFYKVDEEIKKLPYTSTPLLKELTQTISQTQDTSKREELIKRVSRVLQRISGRNCFQKNTCDIYQAEVTLRAFLVSDHEKVLECMSIYGGILSVIIKNGQLLQDLKFKDSLKPFLSNLRKRLDSPQILPYSRIRRDVKAVIKLLSTSVDNPKMLKKCVQFIHEIQTIDDTSEKKVIKLCKRLLKTSSWFQHYLIISWLTLEVLGEEKEKLLKVLLQVVSYYANKLCQQSESYQWKFALTVVENLTKIAKIPDLSEIAIAGNADEGLPGLVDFYKILKNQKCKEIFNQHARSLVYIENANIRHLLLTGIFSELDVSSEEMIKERVENSQSLQINIRAVTKTLHNGKNTLIMTGHFENSEVVAKFYKFQRKQLASKKSFQATRNARFANELFILSRLRRKSNPNIVKLITYDKKLSCLVLNYISKGCLLQFLRRCRSTLEFPEVTDLLHMIVQIADTLVFLEKEKVIHLGIMAENVLLDENFHVFLTGFQCARKREAGANKMAIEAQHVKWMDPEVLHGQPVSHATDVWSLGVFMYEMFTYGCVPYNNPTKGDDQGDFKRKPMTAFQTKGFVHRGGMLPKQPCIPEKLFQTISTKCFGSRATRVLATILRNILVKLKGEMENLPDIFLPSPPQLCLFEEDDVSGNYKDSIHYIEGKNEVSSFTYLEELDADWNEEYSIMADDHLYDKRTYAEPTSNEPVLCRTREDDDCQTKLIVLEFKEFRDITLAEKLRELNNPSLVKVLAINSFAPKNLEMVSESCPLGNVLSALLSIRDLRQHLLLYMIQAASGVVYLHENGILHRHLRAENILMDQATQVKVGRLGFAKEEENLDATYMDEHTLNHSNFATARWNPPEVVKRGKFSKKSDCWSFGIVCWEMSQASISPPGTKRKDILPYKEFIKDDEVLRQIETGARLTDPSSSTLYNIYEEFWEHEPDERMSIHQGRDKLQRLSHLSSVSDSTSDEDVHGLQEKQDSSNHSRMKSTIHEKFSKSVKCMKSYLGRGNFDVRKQEISNATNLVGLESSYRENEKNNDDYCQGEMSQSSSEYEEVEIVQEKIYDDVADDDGGDDDDDDDDDGDDDDDEDDVASAKDLKNSEINENVGTE